MNYCPHCGSPLGYAYPNRSPFNPHKPYTPFPTYPYWFSTAGSGGGEGISVAQKGDTNGTQRSPKN